MNLRKFKLGAYGLAFFILFIAGPTANASCTRTINQSSAEMQRVTNYYACLDKVNKVTCDYTKVNFSDPAEYAAYKACYASNCNICNTTYGVYKDCNA